MKRPAQILPSIVFLLWLPLLIAGCSGKSLDQRVQGRWVEEKEQRSVEFSEQHLYAIVANGEHVETGVWAVDGGEVVMTAHSGPTRGQVVRWKPKFDKDTFTVEKGKAFLRTFVKVQAFEQIFDPRLVGLWRQDGENPEVVEFTPRATMLGWSWRRNAETKTLLVVGGWAKVARGASDAFLLDGWFDKYPMAMDAQHKFRYDSGKLVWTKPYSGGREIVFRKVTTADLDLKEIPVGSPSPNP